MVLGTSSPALAAGQVPASEVTAGVEASVSESQDIAETEHAGQDDGSVSPGQEPADGQESVEMQEDVEEGAAGTEVESDEADIEEGVSVEGSNDSVVAEKEGEDSKVEDKTDSAVEEEKKQENLVGAEGELVSVGNNVTAGFDSETGTITFYSQGGTLSADWKSMLNISMKNYNDGMAINGHPIEEITISNDSDVMHLPANCENLFESFYSLKTLDLSKADTSNVINMFGMFTDCMRLETLDLSGFNTSNVTDMSYMFDGCGRLQTLDLRGFDTSNVTSMKGMFMGCGIQVLDLSGFDTSNVTTMSTMFAGCRSLQTLNVSGFDTSNVTNMWYMFSSCINLQSLDLSGFDTSNVTDMEGMFCDSDRIKTLDLSGFNTSNVTNTNRMLAGCNFAYIILPVNVQNTIDLPSTYIDTSGKQYSRFPVGLSESICLKKYYLNDPENLSLSDDYYGKEGTNASFHIDVHTYGTFSYQWQYKLAGSDIWNIPSQASAKTADYTFKLRLSYDEMQIRCIVTDEYGFDIVSNARNVNVFAFTSQPSDAVVADGQNVTFDVASIGKGLTYQWYYKRPNASWRIVTVNGYNTSSLTVTGGEKNNGTSYRCVVTDSVGNRITSSSAELTVVNTLLITELSNDFYGKVGTEALFHIDAVGQGNLTYQWQYKLAGESKWRTPAQASAKTADYKFKLKNSYENIEVRCIVTDASGNTVTSDIRKANVFAVTKQPTTVFAELGDKVTFAVEGIGQNLTYQWYYRRLDGDWKKVTVAGYNTASLTITAQVKNNGSQYRCYVYDGVGNLIKSRAAMLVERNEEYEG